ncbi:MAG: DUF4270 domain-containing protein [Chitinophagaceae bacterium]|nr:DUF4270 domain-containing protein [Chitinophagaceae bacterium]
MKSKVKASSIVLIGLLFTYFSCKKIDTTEIGGDLIPAVDNVHTFDTVLDVITDNQFLDDSARILRAELHALGVIDDDLSFGKTKGQIYFTPAPDGWGTHPFPKKDSTLIIDSVVLALSYSGVYGDTNAVEQFEVYEMDRDALFYNNIYGYRTDTADVFVEPGLLGSKLVNFTTLNDSVFDKRKRDTVKTTNQLRIQLDKTLANRFIGYDTANAYKSDSLFRTYFKGLAVRVNEGASTKRTGLAYFNLAGDNTRLLFYYRVQNGSAITDTLVASFGFSAINFANSNTIRRTLAPEANTYLTNGLPADDKLFIAASPGTMATIRIPGLKGLPNAIIHRAELSFNVVPTTQDALYTPPGQLFLDASDTANKRIITIPYDFNYANDFATLVGGKVSNGVYRFNLARYVQSVVTRKESDYTLRLSAPWRTNASQVSGTSVVTPYPPASKTGLQINNPIAAGRVVLYGGNNADATKKAKLRIIYTKI